MHADGPALSAGRRQAMTTATTRARPRSLPSTTDQAPDRVRQPVRDRLRRRGRRAVRGLRLSRKGRQLPARRYRAGLPTHLPAPSEGNARRRDHRPVSGYCRDAAVPQRPAGRHQCSGPGTRRRDRPHPQEPVPDSIRDSPEGERDGGDGGIEGRMRGTDNRHGFEAGSLLRGWPRLPFYRTQGGRRR